MKRNAVHRRQVLSTAGAVIIGGLWTTDSVAADQQYTVALTPANGVSTNASGQATLDRDSDVPEATYRIHVDCLHHGTHISFSIGDDVVTKHRLKGAVTRRFVRDRTIAEGTITSADFEDYGHEEALEALAAGDVCITIHTKQYPDGEITGTLTCEEESLIDEETHTLTVSTVDVTAAAPIEANVTVDGETKSTTFEAGQAIAEFELTEGAYTVHAASDAGMWGWVGETEVEIDGADDRVSVSMRPDYPELDHIEHNVDRVEQNDGVKAYVVSGIIENDTDIVSPPFNVEVTLYNSELEQVTTLESQSGHLGLEVGPGESVGWESTPLTETDPGFEDVDAANYDIVIRAGDEGLPISELQVRDGDSEDEEDEPATVITVVDAETGEPIEGAEVLITSADVDPDDIRQFTFTTDEDGRVEENVEVGNFIVTISAEGYQDNIGEVGLEHEYHAELVPEDAVDEEGFVLQEFEWMNEGEPNRERAIFVNNTGERLDLSEWTFHSGYGELRTIMPGVVLPQGETFTFDETLAVTTDGLGLLDYAGGQDTLTVRNADGEIVVEETIEHTEDGSHIGIIRVLNEDCNPVKGETVEIYYEGAAKNSYETDANGEVELSITTHPIESIIREVTVRNETQTLHITRGTTILEFTINEKKDIYDN